MPYLEVMDKKIYYEEHGKGEVVVFLNGIMMSTASWAPFIKAFSSQHKMLLVDFLDQGRSDKADDEYTQDLHVEMLKELLEKLNYHKVHLFGVSYGGEVAQLFALKYQDMVKSLILSNTTSYTDRSMQELERSWDYAAATHDASVFFSSTMPGIYSYKFYEENYEWLKEREIQFGKIFDEEWYEGFRRAAKSAHNLNTTERLQEIKVPTLIISSELDTVTPIKYQEVLYKGIPNSKWVLIKDAGHASMYEKPYEFMSLVMGFISITQFDIKIK